MERLPTGVPNLDEILKGGFPAFSVNVLAGSPGTGKTVLAQEMMFYNAGLGRKGLYVTTLSEPALKVLRYQQAFEFFDESKVGELVFFNDIGTVVREQGLQQAQVALMDLVKEVRPAIVIIDSFKAIHDLAPSVSEFRKFVYDLAVKMSGWQCTTFLVGEYTADQLESEPEFAISDGVLYLANEERLRGGTRWLHVAKMRGSSFLSGRHSYEISSKGLEVFPRKLAIEQAPVLDSTRRHSLGSKELDQLLGGGLPEGSANLLSGAAGTGKTILSLQYLVAGALADEPQPGLMLLYEESEDQLHELGASFGWPVAELVEKGLLTLKSFPIVDLNVDKHLLEVRQLLETTQARRVVVDSLASMLHSLSDDAHRVAEKTAQLVALLRAEGATSILVSPVPSGSQRISTFETEESLVDGVIVLRAQQVDSKRKRSFEVYKLRATRHVMGEHRMAITQSGIRVFYVPGGEEMR